MQQTGDKSDVQEYLFFTHAREHVDIITSIIHNQDVVDGFITGSSDRTVKAWSPNSQGRRESMATMIGHNHPVTDVAFSRSGNEKGIMHPTDVLKVLYLSKSQNIVTVCADNILRIFTRNRIKVERSDIFCKFSIDALPYGFRITEEEVGGHKSTLR